MRIDRFRSTLTFLALLGVVYGDTNPLSGCGTKAWVRAPDLSPNTIVQGDVRVKISAGCPAVETLSLGLRFKERSFMKALRSREDVNKMRPRHSVDIQIASQWSFSPSPFGDEALREEMLLITNKDLWIVREEERVAFEATQVIHVDMVREAGHDLTQEFSILVPSTNFPPALDYPNAGFSGSGAEFANVDQVYEYFVQVSFANGTTVEIPAGLTAFQPHYDEADHPQTHNAGSQTIKLKHASVLPDSSKTSSITSSITADISFTSGMVFSEGSKDQTITVAITHTGPAYTFTRPWTVWACVEPTFSTRWAVEHGMEDSQPMQRPRRQVLRSTREDLKPANQFSGLSCTGPPRPGTSVMIQNPTPDQVQANETVTTSATVTIPVEVDHRLVPNFETFYQTIASTLVISLRTEEDRVDPDVPSPPPIFNIGQWFEEDEEEWIPWVRGPKFAPQPPPTMSRIYTASVPVIVRPVGDAQLPQRCLEASTDPSGQVVMSDETDCKQVSLTHYLSDGARAPTFVDGSVVQELRDKDPAERALLAPLLEPVTSSPPEGEELLYRSHTVSGTRLPMIYVGETWAKKVAYKDWRLPVTAPLGPKEPVGISQSPNSVSS